MKPRYIILVALLTVAAGLLLRYGPRTYPLLHGGAPAPPFRLTSTAGESLSLAELRGKPVVLVFWATWCPPCREEYPLLQSAAKAYADSVQFVGVASQDSAEEVARFVALHGSVFPHLLDSDGEVANAYGLSGIPETYFIDAKGLLRDRHLGPLDADGLQASLQALLEPPRP
jgi:cytochrome c biogenesis protein CcmG, thiol:disulfide interchange protein DsbE